MGGYVYAESAVVNAESKESFVAYANIEPNFFQLVSVANSLLRGPFTVFFELDLMVVIEASMVAVTLPRMNMPVKQHCGVQLQLLPEENSGDTVCGQTFEELEVPSIENSS